MSDIVTLLSFENINIEIDQELDGNVYFILAGKSLPKKKEPFKYLSDQPDYVDSVITLCKNVFNLGDTEASFKTAYSSSTVVKIMSDIVSLFALENISVRIYEKGTVITVALPNLNTNLEQKSQ